MDSAKDNRLSYSQKISKDYAWFKKRARDIETSHQEHLYVGENGIPSRYKRVQSNYDLFNNKINLEDFQHICKPFGTDINIGDLPAKFENRDISSTKIKSILGMEMKRPFSYNVIATNSEATTAREKEEFKLIKDHVVSEIMKPIREELEIAEKQATQGKDLSEEEAQQIKMKIEQELKTKTPEEVKRYMERDYQHPSEVLSQQLLEYLIENLDLKKKINDAFKHGCLSAKQVAYVGIVGGEPEVWVCNPKRFSQDSTFGNEYVEDGEYCSMEYRMFPSEVIRVFNKELSNADIDVIYEQYTEHQQHLTNDAFAYDVDIDDATYKEESSTVRVMHYVWKSLRKIGFLTSTDESNEIVESVVDENYSLNIEAGDIKIEWEWIPEVYETWEIGKNLFKRMGPVPGQFKDLDNLHHCKLPYYGVTYDNLNAEEISLMDRLKPYQFYYNILWYRIENLLATDKGKKILMNIGSIPSSNKFDMKKWMNYAESSSYMWYDNQEEGNTAYDANNVAKVVDLSLVSDIQKYMVLADYVRDQAGKSVGITEAVEGQTSPSETVGNNRQNLTQSSHILEPYFNLHNVFKKNLLQGLLNTAKVAYSNSSKRKLTYVLDDLSRKMLDLDINLLENNTLGVFVSNSAKAEEAKDLIRQLTHAAMQNQTIELSDVISIVRQEGIVEAEEHLKVAEQKRKDFQQQLEQQKGDQVKQLKELEIKAEKDKFEHEKELIVLKEEERRKTEAMKATIMAASFNPDQDVNNNGVNDFLELDKHKIDTEVKKEKNQLDRDKLEHQKDVDKEKIQLEKKKLSKQSNK